MLCQFEPSERLVVAMSGGVDSSAVAWMLHGAGHPLVGLFMRNGVKVDPAEVHKKSCCSIGDARDARMVAASMDIPFQAVDLSQEFGELIKHFIAEYGRGRTPNPCAICNRDFKMGRLIELADELGCAGVATGHYAQIAIENGRVRLRRGIDHTKDQSYQLFPVAEKNLARTVLPLGGMWKKDVRAIAAKAGLRTSAKPDSQEVCFIPSNDYRNLLAERGAELHPGKVIDTGGKVYGDHVGTEHFTIGQRRGHGVTVGVPMYVVETRPAEGLVVVGTSAECTVESMEVADLNWIGFDPPSTGDFRCLVQFRYHCTPAAATVHLTGKTVAVAFDEPQMAVAPGQGAAFYDDDLLLGGGWIGATQRVSAAPSEDA